MTRTLSTDARPEETRPRVDPVMTRLAFEAAVDQLTQPSVTTIRRENGGVERARVPCLLDQLVEATQPGSERSGSSAPGSRPPAALNALALVAEIGQAVRWALSALGHDLFGPGGRVRLAGQVRLWASYGETWQHDDPDYLAYAAGEAERWVAGIRAILDPAPRYFLRGHACPTCGESSVPLWSDAEGDYLRQPALGIDTDRVEAVCAACDSRWGLDVWGQLARTLDAQHTEKFGLDCE